MRIFTLSILTAGILFMIACQNDSPAEQETVLVQVGQQKLYEKDFIDFFKNTKEFQSAKTITGNEIKDGVDKYFAKDLYMLADAHSHGLNKDRSIQRFILKKKMDLLTGFDGPLYQMIIPKEMDVNETEMHDWYEQLKTRIWIGVILVGDKPLADSLRTVILNGQIFLAMRPNGIRAI